MNQRPDIGSIQSETKCRWREIVFDIVMRNQRSFGSSRRSRSVNYVGEVVWGRCNSGLPGILRGDVVPVCI